MSRTSASISALFDADSIAVIGASSTPGRFSHTPLRNLRHYGFGGDVYPVNPRGGTVEGWTCLKALSDIPRTPDHAIVAVRAEGVPTIVTECLNLGVKAITVLASGFGETGTDEGFALQAALNESVAGREVALVGPNTLGIANFNRNMVPFASTILPDKLEAGRIALVSQSGGVGFTTLGRAWHAGIGVGYLVGTGNESVLTVADYIDHFVERPDVAAILCYFESIRHPKSFLAAALRAVNTNKPIVVLRAGKTDVGQRAAAAHTGALTGEDAVTAAVLRQHGVIEVDSIESLITAGGLFARYASPPGPRVGIYAQGGGAAVIMSDKFTVAGMTLPQLAEATRSQLKILLPDTTPGNPLDSGGQFLGGGEDALYDALRLFAEDVNIDVVVHSLLSLTGIREHTYADAVTRVVTTVDKPQLVLQYCAGNMSDYSRTMFRESGVIALDQPDAAIGGIAAWLSYPKLAARTLRWSRTSRPMTPAQLRDSVAQELAALRRKGVGAVLEFDAKQMLSRYGVPVARETIVHDAQSAVVAASEIGFPVVLKLLSQDLTHRTGTGTIALKISDADAVRSAFAAITKNARRLDARIDGVLVARQVSAELELFIGMKDDRNFGTILVLGIGGIWVEILNDAALRMPPFAAADVAEMIEGLRMAPLLRGYRGLPVIDPARLASILAAVAAFAGDMQDHVETMDLNPLMVSADGSITAVDALIILRRARETRE